VKTGASRSTARSRAGATDAGPTLISGSATSRSRSCVSSTRVSAQHFSTTQPSSTEDSGTRRRAMLARVGRSSLAIVQRLSVAAREHAAAAGAASMILVGPGRRSSTRSATPGRGRRPRPLACRSSEIRDVRVHPILRHPKAGVDDGIPTDSARMRSRLLARRRRDREADPPQPRARGRPASPSIWTMRRRAPTGVADRSRATGCRSIRRWS
jgi:hypothetical protein